MKLYSIAHNILTSNLCQWIIPPTVGLSFLSSFGLVQGLDSLAGWKLVLALFVIGLSTSITAIITSIVRLRLGTQGNTITADKNEQEFSKELLTIAYGEMDKQRVFWAGEINRIQSEAKAERHDILQRETALIIAFSLVKAELLACTQGAKAGFVAEIEATLRKSKGE